MNFLCDTRDLLEALHVGKFLDPAARENYGLRPDTPFPVLSREFKINLMGTYTQMQLLCMTYRMAGLSIEIEQFLRKSNRFPEANEIPALSSTIDVFTGKPFLYQHGVLSVQGYSEPQSGYALEMPPAPTHQPAAWFVRHEVK